MTHHLQFAAPESYVSPREASWEKFCEDMQSLLGETVSGDDEDLAHDAFLALVSPEKYVAELRAKRTVR
jgi:hypothetical protein